jgi:hypothetical protein
MWGIAAPAVAAARLAGSQCWKNFDGPFPVDKPLQVIASNAMVLILKNILCGTARVPNKLRFAA